MNEAKKKYRDSKKHLKERVIELEKEKHELRVRLGLIKNIASEKIFNEKEMKKEEQSKDEKKIEQEK